jgi:hypothetical protein
MARYIGPCNRCGDPIDRTIKPRKEPLCFECAIAKMLEQQASYHARQGEGVAFSELVGADAGRQMRAKSGPAYEKWVAGLRRAIGEPSATDSETSVTVTE